jgi:hypothetical protein
MVQTVCIVPQFVNAYNRVCFTAHYDAHITTVDVRRLE